MALVGLAATGLFGGLADAPDPVPTVAADSVAAAAPFRITVHRVVTTQSLGPVGSLTDGRFLLVLATVRNVSSATIRQGTGSDPLTDAMRISGADGIRQRPLGPATGPAETAEPRGVYVLADSSRLDLVAPQLDYEVAWVWEQTGDEPAPEALEVTLRSHTWRASAIDGVLAWRDPAAAGSVRLPVTALPEKG